MGNEDKRVSFDCAGQTLLPENGYVVDTLTINGIDISEFVIVTGTDLTAMEKLLVPKIQEQIARITGITIPVVSASEPEAQYEILAGNTGRAATSVALEAGRATAKFADGKLALVENGTTLGTGSREFFDKEVEIMNSFLERGLHAYSENELDPEKNNERIMANGKAFYYIEPYPFMIGDEIAKSIEKDKKSVFAKAVKLAHETLPTDNITLSIHEDIPDTITIGNVTRPMSVGFGDGETYLATCPIAFPDEIQKRPIIHLPPTSVSQATPKGIEILTTNLDGVKVEQIDYRIAKFIREDMEKHLKGKKDSPLSIYDLTILSDWLNIWSPPRVDCKYVSDKGYLKQFAAVIYEGLWSFHKEGRLHWILGKKTNNPTQSITRFWID